MADNKRRAQEKRANERNKADIAGLLRVYGITGNDNKKETQKKPSKKK